MRDLRFYSYSRELLCLLGVLTACGLTATAVSAQRGWGPGFDDRPSDPLPVESKAGFLFINDEYIAGPYEIRLADDDKLSINGVEYSVADLTASNQSPNSQWQFDRPSRNDGGWNRGGRRSRDRPQPRSAQKLINLVNDLYMDHVLILKKDISPLNLAHRDSAIFLKTVLDLQDGSSAGVPDALSRQLEYANSTELLTRFQPTDEFRERAEMVIAKHQNAEVTSAQQTDALLLSERIGFPLTLIAMVMVVGAFGHLLTNHPKSQFDSSDGQARLLNRKVVVQSLVFVAVFSVIDLVWTLLANQSGSMKELNPLGSGLIESPVMLAAFKIGLTAASIGLLYRLHHQPVARQASWWCCLVLTLLTARWLTFQSMFLG